MIFQLFSWNLSQLKEIVDKGVSFFAFLKFASRSDKNLISATMAVPFHVQFQSGKI